MNGFGKTLMVCVTIVMNIVVGVNKMEHIIICEDCKREIGYVSSKADIKLMSCCRLSPSTQKEYDNRRTREKHKNYLIYKAKKLIKENPENKDDYIMAHLAKRRHYLVSDIYDKVKTTIGHYRTFNRHLKTLEESGKITRSRVGNTAFIQAI